MEDEFEGKGFKVNVKRIRRLRDKMKIQTIYPKRNSGTANAPFYFTSDRGSRQYMLCSYKIYKELERILKQEGFTMSVDKVLTIAKMVRARLPKSGRVVKKNMFLTPQHKSIERLFKEDFG